jgi:hypothetical protein
LIIAIGKQLLITRGALATFSIANDVAKFRHYSRDVHGDPIHAGAQHHGITHTAGAVLSAVIFGSLIIIALVPLALRRKVSAARRRQPAAAEFVDLRYRRYCRAVPGIWIIDQLSSHLSRVKVSICNAINSSGLRIKGC